MKRWLERVRSRIEETVNVDLIIDLACGASELSFPPYNAFEQRSVPRATIAVARDAAFNFIYEDNLDLLRAAGAEIAFFSPLNDHGLPPQTQGLYLCGGFPELYASRLASNTEMLNAIRGAFSCGMPIYAECGGLMYLTQEIVDLHGDSYPMVGLVSGRSVMTGRLTLGYRTLRPVNDNWLLHAGESMRGHEFHYSTWQDENADTMPAYWIAGDVSYPTAHTEGVQHQNLIASYVHLHFFARPELAQRFVRKCAAVRVNLE